MTFKPIPNTLYEASDSGSIRNAKTGRILKPVIINHKPYHEIHRRLRLAAELVLEAFGSSKPKECVTAYLDGNPLNCRLVNLAWKPKGKLTYEDAEAIRKSSRTQVELAEEYGVSQSTISNIINNRVYKEA